MMPATSQELRLALIRGWQDGSVLVEQGKMSRGARGEGDTSYGKIRQVAE